MARASLLLLVLLAAGCAGSSSLSFDRDTSAKCMTLHGARVSTSVHDLDGIAKRAGAGALRAHVGADTATVAFERTEDDAKRAERDYARVVVAAGKPAKYVLFRNRNAVVVWDGLPGDDARATVDDCLVSK